MVIDTTFSEFFFPDDFWFSDCFGDSHDKKVIWPSERIQFCRWKKAIWSFLISSFSFLVLRSVHGRPHFSLTKEDELFICRPCFCMTPPGKSRLGLSCRRPSRRWSPEVDVQSWGLVQMAGPCGVSGVGGGTNIIWVLRGVILAPKEPIGSGFLGGSAACGCAVLCFGAFSGS